jgi:hypothetical protein
MRDYDTSQLYAYFDLLSSIYGGGLALVDKNMRYQRLPVRQHYLFKLLGREFDNRDHGVLSGFFMWKTIEEIFLVGRSDKYRFNISEFNAYTEYVLEQDIARAALAISLHNLRPDHRAEALPLIFPIHFDQYPLTFLLILCDELQEYLRWEGTSVAKRLKFSFHPRISVGVKKSKAGLQAQVITEFSLDSRDAAYVISQANAILVHDKTPREITKVDEAVQVVVSSVKAGLEKKLYLGREFRLRITIYEDWNRLIYCNDCKSS